MHTVMQFCMTYFITEKKFFFKKEQKSKSAFACATAICGFTLWKSSWQPRCEPVTQEKLFFESLICENVVWLCIKHYCMHWSVYEGKHYILLLWLWSTPFKMDMYIAKSTCCSGSVCVCVYVCVYVCMCVKGRDEVMQMAFKLFQWCLCELAGGERDE